MSLLATVALAGAAPATGASAADADSFGLERLQALLQPGTLVELALFFGCLAVAWALTRLLERTLRDSAAGTGSSALAHPAADSVWFGLRTVDGVLFPVLALLLALVTRSLMRTYGQGHAPEALFRLVVPLLLALAAIRLVVRVLHRSFPTSRTVRVVERSVSWLVWLALVLWVTGVLPLLLKELDTIQWKFGATQVSVRNVLEGLVTAAVVLMLALWLSSAIEQRLLQGATDNLSVRKMAANALRALLLFIGLMLALSAAGIDLTALGVLGGALGVGLGFGLQKLAANYVSGFVILAERSMRIGDTVKVDGFEGRITDISTRYTVIRALNGRESIVPNELMITQRVENVSLADPNVQITSVVQVAYGTELPPLIEALVEVMLKVPRVLADPGPGVALSNFAADGLELTLVFWINDPQHGTGNVRSDVNLAVLALFNQRGVEIPFPQRVLRPLPPPPSPNGPAAGSPA